jgi:hypothetical protein
MAAHLDSFSLFLEQELGPGVCIRSIEELPDEGQGYSGSHIGYYLLSFVRPDRTEGVWKVITKDARAYERSVLELLHRQKQAVSPTFFEANGLIIQRYASILPHNDELGAAHALAKIHFDNIGVRHSWLRDATTGFEDALYLRAWKHEWDRNMADPVFASEFGFLEETLLANFADLIELLTTLTSECDSLTLTMVDLNPDDVREIDGRITLIDWDQAAFASLYVDLPNYFNAESALLYRDALAQLGHDIPVLEFMDRFHRIGRYMGFRYLEVGLEAWSPEQSGSKRWFLYYCLHLALHGR